MNFLFLDWKSHISSRKPEVRGQEDVERYLMNY